MSLSDTLLAGTTVDKEGSFTVDVDKAKSKLERFRLSNPLLYTVELVQAAALAGAERVDIEVDADDFALSFVPKRSITRETLDDLESAILVRSKGTHPARLQLALAVSAAAALSPARMSLRADGVVMTIEKGDTRLSDGPSQAEVRFELKEAFRAGHFVEFFKGLVGATEEEKLLKRGCRYAPYLVTVNGKTISKQAWPSPLAVDVVGKSGLREGVGFLPDSTEASRLILLRAGVIQEELAWGEVDPTAPAKGMFAVVDGAHLDRDASFARFVRDGAFTLLLRSLDRHVRDSAALLEPGILEGNVDAIAHARTMARWFGSKLIDSAKRVSGARVVADAPLLVDPLGRPLSLRHVTKVAKDNGGVVLTRKSTDNVDAEAVGDDVIVQLRDGDDVGLVAALGLTTADASERIADRQKKRARYLDFKSRKATTVIAGQLLRQLSMTLGEQVVDVALRADGSAELQVTVVVDGHTLTTLRRPFPVAGLSVLIRGGCRPNATYDDVIRDNAFTAAVTRAVAALPTLLGGPYSAIEQNSVRFADALLPFLATAIDGQVLWRAAKEALALSSGPPPSLPHTQLVGDGAHDVVDYPLLPTFPSGKVSLASLRTLRTPLGMVPVGTPAFQASVQQVVVAGDTMRSILKVALPQRTLVSLDDEVVQLDRQRRVMARQPTTRHVDGLGLTMNVEDDTQAAGQRRSALVAFSPNGPEGLRLRVLFRGRLLQDNTVSGPLVGLFASVDDPSIQLTDSLRPVDVAPLVSMALRAVPRLMQHLAAARDDAAWVLAERLTSLVFPSDAAHAVWRRLAEALGKKATKEWRDILMILDRLDTSARDRALESLIRSKALPSARALTSTTASKAASGLSVLLAPAWHDDGVISGLIRGFSMGSLKLSQLGGRAVEVAALVKAEHVRCASVPGSAPDGFADVVVVDDRQRRVLERLGASIVDCDEEISIARARLAFESRSTEAARLSESLDPLYRCTINTTHVGGELAILKGPPTTSPAASVEVLHRGRRLATVDVSGSVNVSLAAVVEAAEVNPTANFSAIVADRRKEELLTVIRDSATNAVAAVVEGIADRPVANIDDDTLARLVEYVSKPRKRPSETRLYDAIMATPLFVSISGTPVTLGSRSKQRPLQILTTTPPTGLEIPARFAEAVVVSNTALRYVLGRVIETRVDDEALRQAIATEKAKASLPPMPTPPVAPLMSRRTSMGDIEIALYLGDDEHDGRLDVGAEGRLVESIDAPGPVPYAGQLLGMGAVTTDWRRARTSKKLSASIEREAAALWGLALTAFEKHERRAADDVDHDDHHRIERIRRLLVDAAAKLQAAHVRSPSHTPLAPEWLAFKGRLMHAAVLRLDTGGRVSVNEAKRLLPAELRGWLVHSGFIEVGALLSVEEAAPAVAPPDRATTATAAATATATATAAAAAAAAAATPTPTPTTETAATSSSAPTPPTAPPVERLLRDRILSELRTIRSGQEALASEAELARLQVQRRGGKALVLSKGGEVVIDVEHPIASRALDDSAALVVVVCAGISALNELLETLTDDDERRLLVAVARYACTLDAN